MVKKVIFLVALITLVIIIYSNHFFNTFQFDDSIAIENNIYIKNPGNIPSFFTDSSTYAFLHRYRPIGLATFAIDYQIGRGLNPLYFHLDMFFWFLAQLIKSALGITAVANLFRSKKKEQLVSLPVAAIAQGTVDVAFNAAIILFTGVLILVYMVAALFGIDLKSTAVDALLYKNWFWWGLDLVADGLVLIFVAGTWYLLATLINHIRIE